MTDNNFMLSVVVPVYYGEGGEKCLKELYARLSISLSKLSNNYEIILVNDCSPDNSWLIIKELSEKDNKVKAINLSRNFGQHYAITAGLDFVNGDWVVVMDCDLQDRPEEIEKLYNEAMKGYDIVFANRKERQDKFFKKIYSKLFFKTFDYLTNNKTNKSVANFGIYSKKVIHNFQKIREQARSFLVFIKWLGFNVSYVDVYHGERFAGKTSYNFSKMINFAIDSVTAESNKPLRISIKFGFLISLLSFLAGIILIFRYFILDVPIQGWTSIMVALFFMSGLILANLGLIGLYLGKVFDETKKRPLYIIKDTINLKKK